VERTASAQALDPFRRAHDLRETHAELLVHHDGLAARHGLAVDQDVERLTGELRELDHRAGAEREELAHRHTYAAELDAHCERNVEDQVERRGVAVLAGAGHRCGFVGHRHSPRAAPSTRTALWPPLTPATPVIT